MTVAQVVSVSRDSRHEFSKSVVDEIVLVAGHGIEGDAHAGTTVQHLSRVRKAPGEPNLRQVHLIHSELFDELLPRGYEIGPGDLGENVTTRGIDLLGLPEGTLLHIGDEAIVRVTGLRNPCTQINSFRTGLMKAVIGKDDDGGVIRKAGVMSVVTRGGTVRAGDTIRVEEPVGELHPLAVV